MTGAPDKLMVKAICMHGIDIRSAICNRCNSMTRAEADEELALRKMLFDTMRENERLLAISDKVTALTNDSSMICDELRWDALIEWCDKQELPYKQLVPDGDTSGVNAIEIYDDEIRYDGKTIYRGKVQRDMVDSIVSDYEEAQRSKTL